MIKVSFFVGLVATALSVIGLLRDPQDFWHAYLTAFLFISALPLGSLAILLIHGLTTGGWGTVIRRYAEAATKTLPIAFAFFIPVILRVKEIYPWAAANVKDPIVLKKLPYLNANGFAIRAIVFFVIWSVIASLVRNKSRQHGGADEKSRTSLQLVCGLGMLVFVFCSTFAAFDWGMSLTPQWFSTMFGILTVIGNALTAMAFLILISGRSIEQEAAGDKKIVQNYHDLGNLTLALVMLWAYMSFSQFFIIWSANLPEEILWYLPRYKNGWQFLGLGLIVFHFFMPFFLLLNRVIKKNVKFLSRVAMWILIARLCDIIWVVAPTFNPSVIGVSWLYVALPVAAFGWWMAGFGYYLRKTA